jgi:hypothetical protein
MLATEQIEYKPFTKQGRHHMMSSILRLTGLLMISALGILAAQPPTSGLIGYWNFNENSGAALADQSSSSVNGTVSGATWTTGVNGSALSFDGTNDYVTLGSSSALNAQSTMTISVWVYLTSYPTNGQFSAIVNRVNSYALQLYPITYGNPATAYELRFYGGQGFTMYASAGLNPLSLNTWNNIVVTYSDGAVTIYINGMSAGAGIAPTQSTTTETRIGNQQDANGWGESNFWNGKIDQLRFYNRVLTTNEVTSLYNEFNSPPQFTSTAVTTAMVATQYTYTATATDPDAGDVVAYSLSSGPSGMNLNNNVLTWTPSVGQEGSNAVTIRATDSHGAYSEQSFSINVAPASVDIPTNGLVAYWPFDENSGTTAYDATSNANNGTINAATWTPGRMGSALQFDGSTSFVDCGVKTSLNPTSAVTVSVWVNLASYPGFYYSLVQNGDSYRLLLTDWSGAQGKGIRIDGLSGGTAATDQLCSDAFLLNTWYHIAFTFNESNDELRLYVNDGLRSLTCWNGACPTDLVSSIYPFRIGNQPSFGGFAESNFFNGKMDAIRIYNRALSASEITALYLEPSSTNTPPAFVSSAITCATEDVAYNYSIVATDVNAGDVVTLSLVNGPTGMALSGSNLQWTPTNSQVGQHPVILRATDNHGGSAMQSFMITVANTNDAPTITSSAPTVAMQGQVYQYQVQATDVDVGDHLTYSMDQAPSGMTVNSSGLISWTPSSGQTGAQSCIVRVTDQASAYITQSFTVTVTSVNHAPEITTTMLKAAAEDAPYVDTLRATDADGNNVYWFVLAGPESLTVEMSTGILHWSPRQANVGNNQVQVRATDGVLSDTATFTLQVALINDPPVISTVLPGIFKVDSLYTIPLVAYDEENAQLTWTALKKPSNLQIVGGSIVWSPTSSNASLDTIIIMVSDGSACDTLSQIVSVQSGLTPVGNRFVAKMPTDLSIAGMSGNMLVVGVPLSSAASTRVDVLLPNGRWLATFCLKEAGYHRLKIPEHSRSAGGVLVVRASSGKRTAVERVVLR